MLDEWNNYTNEKLALIACDNISRWNGVEFVPYRSVCIVYYSDLTLLFRANKL